MSDHYYVPVLAKLKTLRIKPSSLFPYGEIILSLRNEILLSDCHEHRCTTAKFWLKLDSFELDHIGAACSREGSFGKYRKYKK